jgi:hypothetical protein
MSPPRCKKTMGLRKQLKMCKQKEARGRIKGKCPRMAPPGPPAPRDAPPGPPRPRAARPGFKSKGKICTKGAKLQAK